MSEAPVTRSTLLIRLRDADDHDAWNQFIEIYRPLVYGYCRKRGLQDADAADVTQDVLQAVSANMGRFQYDRAKGTFRGWLFTVVRSKLCNAMSKQKRQVRGSGQTAVQEMLAAHPSEEETMQWDRDHEQRLFGWAADQVRPHCEESTWQAFWQTAVQNQPAQEVAEQLSMTPGAVYIAKCRVLKRIKETLAQVTGAD